MSAIIYSGYVDAMPLIPFTRMHQTVALKRCLRQNDYEDGLKDLWNARADIVIVEHDIKATSKHVDEILACPYILCAYAYLIYPVTTGDKEARIVHANRIGHEYEWIATGDQWADHAGFGFTKLGRLARQEVTQWGNTAGDCVGDWRNLDTRVSAAFNAANLKYHIHWPLIEHDHETERKA